MHPNQERKLEQLQAAWTVACADPTANPAEYKKTSQALSKYRAKLRHERDATIGDGDAVAKLSTLGMKAKPLNIGDN